MSKVRVIESTHNHSTTDSEPLRLVLALEERLERLEALALDTSIPVYIKNTAPQFSHYLLTTSGVASRENPLFLKIVEAGLVSTPYDPVKYLKWGEELKPEPSQYTKWDDLLKDITKAQDYLGQYHLAAKDFQKEKIILETAESLFKAAQFAGIARIIKTWLF